MKFKKPFRESHVKWSAYVKLACATFTIVILLLACIYWLDSSNTPSKLGVVTKENSKEWLNYTVSYFGTIAASFVGFIGAIMAVLLTLKKQNEFRKEDSRKNVLPLIKVAKARPACEDPSPFPPIIDAAKEDQTVLLLPITLENVGQREMYDIWLGGVCSNKGRSNNYYKVLPILYKGDQYSDCFISSVDSSSEESINISLRIYFKDCYDNWYYQELSGMGIGDKISYKIVDFKVKSAPVLAQTSQLPPRIKKSNIVYSAS